MKICLISDLHFGIDNNSESMAEQLLNFFTIELIPHLKKNKIDTIFILGDVFNNRSLINNKIHNDVYDLFDKILNKFKVYVIIGNHDIYYNSTTDVHSLKFLNKFKNVTVIDTYKVLEFDDKKILFMSWVVNQDDIKSILDKNPSDIVVGHFDIAGFNFNKSVLSKDGISANNFINHSLVFSGHFHTRSVKTINQTEIVYIGSPYQINRGDMDEDRGATILDLSNMKYELFSNNQCPKFLKLNYPTVYESDYVKNNKVDVYITYDKDNYTPELFNAYIDSINSMNPYSLNAFYVTDSKFNSDNKIDNCNFSSIPELFNKYLEVNNVSNKQKHILSSKFLNIYNKLINK